MDETGLLWAFPVLERVAADGTPLTFERRYRLEGDEKARRLRFDTALRVADRETIRNTTLLWPARREELASVAEEFFADVEWFGDFDAAPWTPRSPATILVCRRTGRMIA